VLLEKPPIDFTKQTPAKRPIRIDLRRSKPGSLSAIYRFQDDVQRVRNWRGWCLESHFSAPRNQGNWASRRALAWAAVSLGATRRGAGAGGAGMRARRSRWLRP